MDKENLWCTGYIWRYLFNFNSKLKTMQEQKTDMILKSLAEGVITVDKEFKITFINEAASLMTGFHKDEVIGRICKDVLNQTIVQKTALLQGC